MFARLQTLSHKTRAALAGVFILTAYLMLITEVSDSEVVGLIVEVVSGLSVIGIALLLYPYFLSASKKITALYVASRLIEGIVMIISGFMVLAGNYEGRDIIYQNIHIYMFISGAAFMYWLFGKTKLIPRFIVFWGYIAVFFLALITVLGWFGIDNEALQVFLVLIITNEIFLAGWLIVKGLNLEEINKG